MKSERLRVVIPFFILLVGFVLNVDSLVLPDECEDIGLYNTINSKDNCIEFDFTNTTYSNFTVDKLWISIGINEIGPSTVWNPDEEDIKLWINNTLIGNPTLIGDIPCFETNTVNYKVMQWENINYSSTSQIIVLEIEDYNQSYSSAYRVHSNSTLGFSTLRTNLGGDHDGVSNGTSVGYYPHARIWFSNNSSMTGEDDWMDFYINEYGDFFCELFTNGSDCYYEVGDKPILIYNLSADNLSGEDYYYYIIHSTSGQPMVMRGLIGPVGSSGVNGVVELDSFEFQKSQGYWVVLFNVTEVNESYDNLGSIELDSLVYMGSTIYVCEADEVTYTPPDEPLSTDSLDYIVPIVFMTSLLIGGFMYYISSSGVFAGLGFMGALMFFATPGHAFSYLPTIYLFIVGLIVIVFAIFMFRS